LASVENLLPPENKIGATPPCYVIVRDLGDGGVGVAAIDPRAPMREVGSGELDAIAAEVAARCGADLIVVVLIPDKQGTLDARNNRNFVFSKFE